MEYSLHFKGVDGELLGGTEKDGDQAERIEDSRLDIRQEGVSSIGVRVPKGQVSGHQLPRFEDPEDVELVAEVAAREVASVPSKRGNDSPVEKNTEERQQQDYYYV
jgi:hypothetical protein